MKKALVFLILLLVSYPSLAQDAGGIVIDLAEERVDIESNFAGKKVIVFGTVSGNGDIAIVLRGPENRVTIRQRKPVFGIWVNRNSMQFKRVPLFYDYAVTRSEALFADNMTLKAYNIGLNNFTLTASGDEDADSLPEFQEALIRTQQSRGFYPLEPKPVSFVGARLFRTSFYLPSDVPVGRYKVDAYLFNNGQVISSHRQELQIAQAGLSADVVEFSSDHSIAYAVTGLLIALLAGFFAFWMARRDRI